MPETKESPFCFKAFRCGCVHLQVKLTGHLIIRSCKQFASSFNIIACHSAVLVFYHNKTVCGRQNEYMYTFVLAYGIDKFLLFDDLVAVMGDGDYMS